MSGYVRGFWRWMNRPAANWERGGYPAGKFEGPLPSPPKGPAPGAPVGLSPATKVGRPRRHVRELGTVADAGGGEITLIVDRDMKRYPTPGAKVFGFITGPDVWSSG